MWLCATTPAAHVQQQQHHLLCINATTVRHAPLPSTFLVASHTRCLPACLPVLCPAPVKTQGPMHLRPVLDAHSQVLRHLLRCSRRSPLASMSHTGHLLPASSRYTAGLGSWCSRTLLICCVANDAWLLCPCADVPLRHAHSTLHLLLLYCT